MNLAMMMNNNHPNKKPINHFNTLNKMVKIDPNLKSRLKAKISKTTTHLPDAVQFKFISWNNMNEIGSRPVEQPKKQLQAISVKKENVIEAAAPVIVRPKTQSTSKKITIVKEEKPVPSGEKNLVDLRNLLNNGEPIRVIKSRSGTRTQSEKKHPVTANVRQIIEANLNANKKRDTLTSNPKNSKGNRIQRELFINQGKSSEDQSKPHKTREEKEAILNKIFLKVASRTATNGFYKPNNFFEDTNKACEDFDKFFSKSKKDRELNENELRFVNVRKQHEDKEFRDKIIKEKEKIKDSEMRRHIIEAKNKKSSNKNPFDKEVVLFDESFNNLSLIEHLEKIDGLDDHFGEIDGVCLNDKFDSQINLSLNEVKKCKEKAQENLNNDDSILIEEIDPKMRNTSKQIEGSTKISKNENSSMKMNGPCKDESSNMNNNVIKKKDQKEMNEFFEKETAKKREDEEDEEANKSLENLIVENKFSKSGANFYPKIQSENVPDLLKRILEKNKKEASARQREYFNNMTNQKNMNLNKNSKLIFNMERPSTQHSSKTNPFIKKQTLIEEDEITYDVFLSDVYFWRKHEELWSNLGTSAFKISSDFDNYFIPKYESEILYSIFFKNNGIIKDRLTITDKVFNPKHEMKKWKDAYKVAIKRWHPDKLIPLLADLKIIDDVKSSLILKKCGSILNSINRAVNTIIDLLKKIANKQAPKL